MSCLRPLSDKRHCPAYDHYKATKDANILQEMRKTLPVVEGGKSTKQKAAPLPELGGVLEVS